MLLGCCCGVPVLIAYYMCKKKQQPQAVPQPTVAAQPAYAPQPQVPVAVYAQPTVPWATPVEASMTTTTKSKRYSHAKFDLFISHSTKDDSHAVFQAVQMFMSAKEGLTIFNPTTHLSHVEQINTAAMQEAVRQSGLVIAALSEEFFMSPWCEAEIAAAKEAGIKVIPVYSGNAHGADKVDKWVHQYKAHRVYRHMFKENARDVLNKQNPDQVTRTLNSLWRQHLSDLEA